MERAVRGYEVRVCLQSLAPETTTLDEQASDYWRQEASSYLRVYIEDACRVPVLVTAMSLADAARRWFARAWRDGTRVEHRFPVESFTILIYSQPDGAGRVLIEVDVLRGRIITLAC